MYAYSTVGPVVAPYTMGAAPYMYNAFNRFRYGWGPNYGLGYGGYLPYGATMMGYGSWY